jgi:hypothetical protein
MEKLMYSGNRQQQQQAHLHQAATPDLLCNHVPQRPEGWVVQEDEACVDTQQEREGGEEEDSYCMSNAVKWL